MRNGRQLTQKEIQTFASEPGASHSAVQSYLRALNGRVHRSTYKAEEQYLYSEAGIHRWTNDTYKAAWMGLYAAYH